MIRSAVVLSVLLSSGLASAALAQGPIVGDVEGGEFRPFPLAVPQTRTATGSDTHKACLLYTSRCV